jgi:hypothetical protein
VNIASNRSVYGNSVDHATDENPGILETRLIIRNPDDNFHHTERQVLCPGSDHPDTTESKLLSEDLLFLFLSCERHPEENL